VVLTKIPELADKARLESIGELVARYAPQAQLHLCRFKPKRLRAINLSRGSSPSSSAAEPFATAALAGARVLLVSAIARPQSFESAARSFCRNIVSELTFPDHHWYRPADIRAIEREMARHKAEFVVTTEKDVVKLAGLETALQSLHDKIFAVELATEWLGESPQFALAPAHEVLT
jgi:tetraacyldisaccharide 4'-kinase